MAWLGFDSVVWRSSLVQARGCWQRYVMRESADVGIWDSGSVVDAVTIVRTSRTWENLWWMTCFRSIRLQSWNHIASLDREDQVRVCKNECRPDACRSCGGVVVKVE